MALGRAFDSGNDVLCSDLGSLVGALHDLGNRLAILQEERIVANDVGIRVIDALHLGVDLQASSSTLALGQLEPGGEGAALDSAGPYEGFGLHNRAILEQDLAGFRAGDRRVEHDLAPALLKISLGLDPQRLLEDGQDGWQRLYIDDSGLVTADEMLAAHRVAIFEQLAYQLNACEAGACHHECQHPLALDGVKLLGGTREYVLDMVPKLHRIIE